MTKVGKRRYKHKGYIVKPTFDFEVAQAFSVKWYTESRRCDYANLRADTLLGMVRLINSEVDHFKSLRS